MKMTKLYSARAWFAGVAFSALASACVPLEDYPGLDAGAGPGPGPGESDASVTPPPPPPPKLDAAPPVDPPPPPPKLDAAPPPPKPDAAPPPKLDAAPAKPDVAPPPPPPPPPPVAATPTCAGVQVFVQQCNFCHVQAGIGKIGLITEANLIDRLKAKSTSGTCTDRPLVDSTVGADGKATGVLFDRLTGTSCGPRMPPSGAMSNEVIDCIRLWAGAKIKGQ